MTDVRMKLSLRDVDGKVVPFGNTAFPSNMTIGQVLNEAERLQNVTIADVQLTCIEREVVTYKAFLYVFTAGHNEMAPPGGPEQKKTETVTTGFEQEKSDSKSGSTSNEFAAALTAGWAGAYVTASATVSGAYTSENNWTSSRTESLSTSETTTTTFSFPNGVHTQYCKWCVNIQGENGKLTKFFLPGPSIQLTDSKDHNGKTKAELEKYQPDIELKIWQGGVSVDDGTSTTEIPYLRKADDWFFLKNKRGNYLTCPGSDGSDKGQQLTVEPKKQGGDYWNQQWSWAGTRLDRLECRHNESRSVGSGKDELYVAVKEEGSDNGAKVIMWPANSQGDKPTWQSQNWTMVGENIVNACGLLLSTKGDGGAGSKVHLWEDVGAQNQDWERDHLNKVQV